MTSETEIHPQTLDLFPRFENLDKYREALSSMVEFINSDRYKTLEDLRASDYEMLGWMHVQEQTLGITRERLEEKLHAAQEAAHDPNRNRLFQEHGRHWTHFISEGETEEEARQTARHA